MAEQDAGKDKAVFQELYAGVQRDLARDIDELIVELGDDVEAVARMQALRERMARLSFRIPRDEGSGS